MLGPYLTKMRLKSKELARKFHRPARILDLDKFYSHHWHGDLPSADYFSKQADYRFFFDPKLSTRYKEISDIKFPGSRDRIMQKAQKAAAHVFDLLGSGECALGHKIDWHRDFKSGKRWNPKPFYNIQLVNLNDKSDIKVPWELSRLQFFTDIGRAYWLTDDPDYAKEFREILKDWEDSNPIDTGVNWTCSMEIAIRAINIIWGLHYFAADIDDDFVKKTIRLLYYHGLHIEKNLEIIKAGSNSNHLISDYLGLFYISIMFPQLDKAESWKNIAIDGLENEIRAQVKSDGADYECSTSYHRLVLEMFLSAFILGRANSISFSDEFNERLRRMIEFSIALTAPSGRAPLAGDNDDGFIVKISIDEPFDHRPLIDVGLTAFGEVMPLSIPMSEERLWYLGQEALQLNWDDKISSSKLFKESGYAVIKNDRLQLLFNCAGIPEKALGGHKHNDLLSFTFEVDGIPYFIDPGTYCYSADYKMRNLSRSTTLHNTVRVDGQEQNRFFEKRLFFMKADAEPRINLWANDENRVVVSASHNGYQRIKDSIIHTRTIWVTLDSCSVMIQDDFAGVENAEHKFELTYISPLIEIRQTGRNTMIIGDPNSKHMALNVSEDCLVNGSFKDMEYFPRYGVKKPAALITFTYSSKLPLRIVTRIADSSTLQQIENRTRMIRQNLNYKTEKAGLVV